jgi:hypothetical protein
MDPTDLLLVGIEVSVAFACFAGIVATFQFGGETQVKRGDVVGLTLIVQISLMSALLCLLPVLLSIYGIEDRKVWAVSSAVGAVYGAGSMYYVDKNMRGAVRRRSIRLLFGSFQGVFFVVVVALVLNTLDVLFHRIPGPYLTGIALGFCLDGYMFTRLLLRPLWQSVFEHEAAKLRMNGSV